MDRSAEKEIQHCATKARERLQSNIEILPHIEIQAYCCSCQQITDINQEKQEPPRSTSIESARERTSKLSLVKEVRIHFCQDVQEIWKNYKLIATKIPTKTYMSVLGHGNDLCKRIRKNPRHRHKSLYDRLKSSRIPVIWTAK